MATKPKAKAKVAAKPKAKAKAGLNRNATSRGSSSGGVDYAGMARDYSTAKSGEWFSMGDRDRVKLRPIPFFSESSGRMKLFTVEEGYYDIHPSIRNLQRMGADCPINNLAGETDDKELLNRIRPRKKYLINVIDRDDPEQRIQQFRSPKAVWSGIMDVITDTEEFPDALSEKSGIDFIINRTGSGLNTEYKCTPSPKRTPVQPSGAAVDFDAYIESRTFQGDVDVLVGEIREYLGL